MRIAPGFPRKLSRNARWTVLTLLACMTLMPAATYADLQEVNALGVSGVNVDAYRGGVSAYRQAEYDRALPMLRQAMAQDPDNVNIRYYLALVLDKLDRGAEALGHYAYVGRFGDDPRVAAYARQRAIALDHTDARQTLAANEPVLAAQQAVLVPLQPHQNALMVEALLNNRVRGNFIVDTGATYTSISQEMADQLGATLKPLGTVHITTANGRIEARKVVISHISVNGVEARDVEATVIDVRPGSSFSGLLGLSFIRQFRLTIDPQQGLLVFQPH